MGTGDKHSAEVVRSSSINELTRQAHKRLQKGDLQGALEHYERAVEEAKSGGDLVAKISSCLNAGACLVSLEHYRRGIDQLEAASRLLKKAGVTVSGTKVESTGHEHQSSPAKSQEDRDLFSISADVHFNMAVAAQGLKDFKKATRSFKTSIDHYLRAGAKSHAADCFTTLAGCSREAGQTSEEVTSLVSAQQLYSELEDVSNEAMTCVELAKVYLRIGQKDECRKMLAMAKLQAMRVDNQTVQGQNI